MQTHRLLLLTAVCLVTSGTPVRVLAHGEQAHGKKPVAVKKEQKAWGIAGTARAGMVGKVKVVGAR